MNKTLLTLGFLTVFCTFRGIGVRGAWADEARGEEARGEEAPKVQTDRRGARHLPLPREEGVFHFAIFGDRTGGPVEGIRVLEQAVRDTNLLDPDLVMTVGDLVEGYNQADKWMGQMEEFRGVMDGLSMPWFPVAGNHDIYWRGKDRPPEEHEQRYEKHFGPVWYWFEHKDVGFLVLYTDEGDGTGAQRNFSDEAMVQFSKKQLDFVDTALAELRKLRQVFVFLHHPRWMKGRYKENNWDEVHQKLVEAGNVEAVFAGHIHRMHYAGKRDGIEYISLATTGGHLPMEVPYTGYLHHLNIVTVRPEGIKVSALPVGSVLDPRDFTTERWEEIDKVRHLRLELPDAPIEVAESGRASGLWRTALQNESTRPIDAQVTLDLAASWLFSPDHYHVRLEPGEKRALEFAYLRKGTGWDYLLEPGVILQIDYLAEGARVSLPSVKSKLRVRPVFDVPADAEGLPDRALVLDGESSVRVDSRLVQLGKGAFTVEAWVRVPKWIDKWQGVVGKVENSEYALALTGGRPSFQVWVGGAYKTVRAEADWMATGTWHHLAGVHDGKEARLYIDGKLAGTVAAEGERKRNGHPIYVGNDPNGQGQPAGSAFSGEVDEVRISYGVRYTGNAPGKPPRRHLVDESTRLLLRFDSGLGRYVRDSSSRRATAKLLGRARLELVD